MARAEGSEMKLFDPKHRREVSRGQRLVLVGTELSLSIFIGLAGGHWLDGRLQTRPWLTLVGLVLGTIAGFKGLYEVARREKKALRDPQPTRSDSEVPPPPPTSE